MKMEEEKRNMEPYYELIAKKIHGELNQQEEKEFEVWVNSSPENHRTFDQLQKAWEESGKISFMDEPLQVDTDVAWNNLSDKIQKPEQPTGIFNIQDYPKKQRNIKTWLSIAASIVLLISVGGIYEFFTPTSGQDTYITDSTPQQFQFSDGSLVELNSNSVITIGEAYNDNTREVFLEGEAFFDIAKDKQRPFIIHTNAINVLVTGTSFYVKSGTQGHNVEVIVETGNVKLTDINNPLSQITLSAGENAVYQTENKIFDKVNKDVNSLFWKTKTLVFSKMTLKEVVGIINQCYNVNIVLSNKNPGNCKLTATFKDQGIKDIVEVIKATFDLNVKEDDTQIKFYGEACESI